MPQLDKITFFSQFFWLSFFYLFFYFFIYKYFLPKMSRALKFRKRRMNNSQQGVTSMAEESYKVGNSYQALLSTGLTTCKTVFSQNFKTAEEWLNNTVSTANQTKLKKTNTAYIFSLGERCISQRYIISQPFMDVSQKTSLYLCLHKLKFLYFGGDGTRQQSLIHSKYGEDKKNLSSTEKEEKSTNKDKNKTKKEKEREENVGKDSKAKSKTKLSYDKNGASSKTKVTKQK